MKIKVLYLLVITLLVSCNQDKRHLDFAQKKAEAFLENHATAFINDTALLQYSYNPRGQFSLEQDSTNRFRVYPGEHEIRLICFTDSCKLFLPLKQGTLSLRKGTHTIKQDSIFTELAHAASTVVIHPFDLKLEAYFNSLKNRLDQYGVFAYNQGHDKSFIRVYFTTEYYLIRSKAVKQDIADDEIIKSYEGNWYFVKMARPMDLG
jgi:hypothetical protein